MIEGGPGEYHVELSWPDGKVLACSRAGLTIKESFAFIDLVSPWNECSRHYHWENRCHSIDLGLDRSA